MAFPGTLVECLDAGAAGAPREKVAVSGGGPALSHGQLRDGARGVASALAAAGVGRGSRVGLWLEKSPAAVLALAGALRAGAAYVPLDPRAPAARVAAVAQGCGLDAIVADAVRAPLLPGVLARAAAPRLVLVAGAAPPALPWPAARLEDAAGTPPADLPAPAPGDLAYVLYTSGSTGVPKGVAHTHASGIAFVRWVQARFGIREDDVFSSHAPFHFDLSISDLFASLGAGASVRLLTGTETMVAPLLVRTIAAAGITVWYSVPSALVAMLEQGGLEETPLPALRTVLFAGEVFPPAQLARLRRALPGPILANLFGPTETNVCTYQVVPGDFAGGAPLPIGIACENLETFVLDAQGREVRAPGAEGTLWVKGGNLMLGYWNDPERTAAVLGPDPRGAAGTPGPACNTGDVVRLRADGGYDFRGRRDHLVKTRGYRVELGDVEAALAAHPAVREAVAVPLPDPSAGNVIVASVVARAGNAVEPRSLRAWVGARLPGYMVPAAIEVRDELPRTSTGKADRTALRGDWERKEGRA
jgi:amino acid adenylation domain-containing protein